MIPKVSTAQIPITAKITAFRFVFLNLHEYMVLNRLQMLFVNEELDTLTNIFAGLFLNVTGIKKLKYDFNAADKCFGFFNTGLVYKLVYCSVDLNVKYCKNVSNEDPEEFFAKYYMDYYPKIKA